MNCKHKSTMMEYVENGQHVYPILRVGLLTYLLAYEQCVKITEKVSNV